jgi:hypothetical protein
MAGLEDAWEILLNEINVPICFGYKRILTFLKNKFESVPL